MPPTLHARLGASGAKRWMSCPGSIRMTEGMKDTGSLYAWEGTAAHEVAERCLRDGTLVPADLVGETILVYVGTTEPDDGTEPAEIHTEIEVTEEMATAVTVFVEHVRERFDCIPSAQTYIERRGSLEKLNPPAPMFGTADAVLWDPQTEYLEVIDYKHGQGVVVEVERNPQLMYYALIASVLEGRVPKRGRITVAQPRVAHPDGPIRHWDFTGEELVAFKHELFAAAAATQEPDAPLQVGAHCKFCLAKATCPAQLEHATDLIGSDFSFDVEPKVPAPATLTPDDLATILHRAAFVMDWLREVESYALGLAEHGTVIPGYKLVEKRTNRVWKDPEAAERYLARKGLKKSERTKASVISPNQAETVFKSKGIDAARLERHIHKPEGAPKLVPTEDARPQIPSSVEKDFDLLPPPATA